MVLAESSGRENHTESSSWSSEGMTSLQILPTFSPGAWWTHQLASSARRGDSWSIFSAAVQSAWERGGTVGTMTKFWGKWKTPSALGSTTVSSNTQQSISSPLSVLGRSPSQRPRVDCLQQQETGNSWLTEGDN